MAEKILKQNKIPGCERLTRPEEIKALSKYLRNIKETLEENTDLEETTLEVPGKTTGQLHNISELPDDVAYRLETINPIESLYDSVIGLEDTRDIGLSEHRENLEDNREPELSGYRDDLEDNREINLSDYKETVEDNREIGLGDHIEGLEDTRDTELFDYRENLEDNREINLSDYKDVLEDKREPKLSDYRDNIEDDRTPELSDFKDTLEDNRDNILSDYRDDIVDEREPELSDYQDKIEDTRDNSLGDYRENIYDNRDLNLSDYRDDIVDERELELSDYKETISDIPGTEELPNTTDELVGGEFRVIPSLPDFKDTIVDTRDNTLEDYRDPLTDTREPELEDTRLDITDEREPTLEDTRIDISDTRDNSLSDVRIDITDLCEPELSDVRLDIQDDRNPELPDTRLDLEDTRENALSDFREDLTDERENSLSDYKESFAGEVNEVESLYDAVLGLEDDREPELSDYQEELTDEREPELSDTIIERPDNNEEEARIDGVFPNNEWNTDGSPGYYGSFDDVIPKLVDDRETELSDHIENLEDDREPELEDFQDTLTDDRDPELSDVIIEALENENPDPLYETLANLSEGDLYNFVLQIYNEREHDSDLEIDSEWKEKISGLISAFLNPDDPNYKEVTKPISPRNAHRFEDELFRSIRLIDNEEEIEGSLSRNSDGTGRIDGDYDFIDGTNTTKSQVKKHTEDDYKDIPISEMPQDSTELMIEYIRYLAEQKEHPHQSSGHRRSSRRHPCTRASGSSLRFSKYIREKPNPINRPEVNFYGEPKKTYAFELGNSRYEANKKKGNAGVIGNLWDSILNTGMNAAENFGRELLGAVGYDRSYLFVDNYLTGGGIRTTLSDLCKKNVALVGSVEDLLDTLKDSPYITTPNKFGTIHEGSYGTQTLDSNSYWEVIIEPLCDDYLNGGYSYLPCFNEINVINMAAHGVRTAYNKWVPISNFELQKSKLTTKSIGLYDGEFSFPVSAELTNEIRFTVVDDQYKSWRNYFQKCMDVAVYNSESHKKGYYDSGGITSVNIPGPFGISIPTELPNVNPENAVTVVDKSIITVAFYKNITFRIRIYIMTPQYSTIRRFDLLCVLKDFAEEYSGDVDGGGVDLNVTFSIVGENPNGADQDRIGDIGNRYADNLIREYYSESIPPIPSYDEPDLLGRITVIDE